MTLTAPETDCPPVDPDRPFVEYDERSNQTDAYRHADGSITYVVYDDDGSHANPRSDTDVNIATLIQRNDRCIGLDDDTASLSEAYGRWHNRYNMHLLTRYLRMFRPDILHFAEWTAGDSYGYGYVTREQWDVHMVPSGRPMTTDELTDYLDDAHTAKRAEVVFDQEVDLYRQWADGEVYGGVHVKPGKPIVVLGDHGAYVTGWHEDEDSCWGFLGYDSPREIASQFTDSPITEVLA